MGLRDRMEGELRLRRRSENTCVCGACGPSRPITAAPPLRSGSPRCPRSSRTWSTSAGCRRPPTASMRRRCAFSTGSRCGGPTSPTLIPVPRGDRRCVWRAGACRRAEVVPEAPRLLNPLGSLRRLAGTLRSQGFASPLPESLQVMGSRQHTAAFGFPKVRAARWPIACSRWRRRHATPNQKGGNEWRPRRRRGQGR